MMVTMQTPPSSKLEITIFSKNGGVLTKNIQLGNNGQVISDGAACVISSGWAVRTPIADLHALAAVIEHLKSCQAIALGTLRHDLPDKVKIVSRSKLNGEADSIARTRENIVFREHKPAPMLLDFDRKGMPDDVRERLGDFWDTLITILPGLNGAAHLIRSSTSAGLFRTDIDERIEGSGGLHGYVVVKDGGDVERFLHDLHDRAWLKGYGWWTISKAGVLLERSIIDRSVGSPERLVFEAPPILVKPLAQDADARQPIVHDGKVLDTRVACPPLTPKERQEVDKLKAEAKARIQPEADKVRGVYVEEQAKVVAKRTGKTIEEAKRIIESQCGGVLLPDIVLEFIDQELQGATVGDVLDDPERFDHRVLADPIEGPSYGRQTAMVLLRRDNGQPWVKSFAHGGMSYSLHAEPAKKCSLYAAHAVFRKWLGEEYDLDALDAVLAAGACERLTGDPLWLLLVSGPGAAKTETVQALSGADAHVISTIASEGALLSATGRKERSKSATGGLLRKIGARGIVVVKDVTSILSADRHTRASVLAAIREIHDGHWVRNVGSDGGQTLEWVGRIVIIGAVTTAWDAAHAVVAVMGDRFVLLRINSNLGRVQSGMKAIRNTGSEVQMRAELAAAVGGVVMHASTDDVRVSDADTERLLKAADIVTMARTAVERDYQGEVIDSHAPEMPTRFAKQLTQLVRGGIAIGMTRKAAMRLAIRCARDSIPPLRLEILLDIALRPRSRPSDVRQRIGKPWRTTKRELEALTMLGLLQCDEQTTEGDRGKTIWRYSLGNGFDVATLYAMAGRPNAAAGRAAEPPRRGAGQANHRQKCE